jgi:hypothetical protein
MKKLLFVYGFGAIGRSLPWTFPPEEFDYVFKDTNKDLIETLIQKRFYQYMLHVDLL